MLKGRLGLNTARVPQADRHGLLWLGRGKVSVDSGCLLFATDGYGVFERGRYQIPFQTLSVMLLGPGTLISHDALRLLARHQTGLLAVGEDGVRFYASMPKSPDDSELARAHAMLWANPEARIEVARRMYERRMGQRPKATDLNALRGLEGARMKAVYKKLGVRYGVSWSGRSYDRQDPEAADAINKAINHASTAVTAAAMVATAVVGAIPQLGFIHEASGRAFPLDIADLYRATVTLPIAFESAAEHTRNNTLNIERITRRRAGRTLTDLKLVAEMIDVIKELLDDHDSDGDT